MHYSVKLSEMICIDTLQAHDYTESSDEGKLLNKHATSWQCSRNIKLGLVSNRGYDSLISLGAN